MRNFQTKIQFIFITLIPFVTLGQSIPKVVLQGKLDSPILQNLSIYSYGINNNLEDSQLDTIFSIKSHKPFKIFFTIFHKGMYGIQDGIWSMFTHHIFLRPGDSISFSFSPRPHYEEQLKSLYPIFTEHIMNVKSKYPGNITYFDDIANIKPLKYGHIKGESLLQYKHQCDSVYKLWMIMLNNFIREGIVSNDFISYARAELFSSYILWLTDPAAIIPRKDFPAPYFSLVDTPSFNNIEYMSSLPSYESAAWAYNSYIINRFNVHDKYENLKNEFNTIMRDYTGVVLYQMMGIEILNYLGKRNLYFDTAYTIFLRQCQNKSIRHFVENKIKEHRLTATINEGKANWGEVLSGTLLYSPANKLVTLKQALMQDKFCLIDCWATWCAPCRVQMPYLKTIEKKFKDSVIFISISLDKERKRWKDFINNNTNNLCGRQYLLGDIVTSAFITYFKVQSIPRYILLSKDGSKVLVSDMPQPILIEKFTKILSEHISNN